MRCRTGHALRHTSFLQIVMEASVCVTPVAMERRLSVRIGFHCILKVLVNSVVIPITCDTGNNMTVIEVKDSAKIDLLNPLIPFEHILHYPLLKTR